jgi:hypothetical protein
MNVVLEDYDASVKHWTELYGGNFMLDLPRPEWHACLLEIGGVIFEIFAPGNFLLNSRHGPHYLGFEYEAKMSVVRAALESHGVRIIRDHDVAVHTHPADGLGVAWEFYEGTFHGQTSTVLAHTERPIEYWRDEHPLGLMGLKAFTLAVSDIEASSKFVQSFLSGEVKYDEARPALGGRAIGLQVADAILELQAPTGDGPLRRDMELVGQGIRSTVFKARSLEQARRYFNDRDVKLIDGSAPGRFAVDPAANRGVLFEFQE